MNESQPSESYLSVSYLQQYQLHREPFAVDTDSNQDDFFLLDSERAQRLNMLYHMCQNSELLLVVTGVNGSGKTSLLSKFIDMRTDSWRQCVVNATATTNPDQLLIEIAEGFGLPQDTVTFDSGLEMLQKRLTEMKRSELMPILMIDDAHKLPAASLTILLKLSELADSDERLLRIVLFGEPNINDMFNAPELKEIKHRITHTLTMPALNEQQTFEYIKYRLSVAGLQSESPFTTSQMKTIHRQANGIPELINQYAQGILLDSTTNNKSAPLSATKLRSGLTVILILSVAGVITWFLTHDVINSLGETQSERVSKLETHNLPLLPPSKILPETKEFDAISGNIYSIEKNTDAKQNKTSQDNPIISVDAPATETKNPILDSAKKVAKTQIDSSTTALAAKSDKKSDAVIKPVIVSKTEETNKQPIKVTSAVKPVSKPKPVPSKTSWLSQQSPDHFTLQIMGSRKRSSLTLVQRAHKIGSESAIIRTKLKGSDWYILIYKSFPSKQRARDAAKSLPKALQLTQPWPRRLGELKNLK